MRYFVTVKTKAREERFEAIDATHFRVTVKALPIEGRANTAVAKALARNLGVAVSRLTLIAGASGTRKVFEIM